MDRCHDRRALGFTLVELLTVIAIISLMAGLLVGLAPAASRKMKESRIEAELAQLVSAIEAFKAEVGYYPPDSPRVPSAGVTNYAVNQLFYELTGTVVTNAQNANAARYSTANGLSTLSVNDIYAIFQPNRGFVNVSEDRKAVKNFLPSLREKQYREVTALGRTFYLLVVPMDLSKGAPPAAAGLQPAQVNPWRYNSSAPLHNPGRFDLWAEVYFGKQKRVFGNWKE
jgi:prepilin-type N-terminal cleavage/methylation domain-containing protein